MGTSDPDALHMNFTTIGRLTDLVAAIREATASPEQRAQVLQECARILPIDHASVTTGRVFPAAPGTSAVSGARLGSVKRVVFQDRDRLAERYFAEFFPEDPYLRDMASLAPSYQELERLANWRTVRGSRYFHEFLAPMDLTRTVRIVVPIRDQVFCSLDLNWDRPGDRVQESDRHLAVMIAGQIASSIATHPDVFVSNMSGDLALRHADAVREAAFLVDPGRHVHDRNSCADELLRADPAFAVRHGRLGLRDDAAQTRLCRILSSAATGALPDGNALALSVPSAIGPVPYRAQVLVKSPQQGESGATLAMIFVPLGSHVDVEQRSIQAQLTPRERHCMLALLELGSEEAAAAAMGITLNTLRTHRKASYLKLGVSNRRELADALLGTGDD